MAAFILTYRLSPTYGEEALILDGKRAIQIIRSRAAEWKRDPHRVGFIGFSAGSSLGRSVAAGDKSAALGSAQLCNGFDSRRRYRRADFFLEANADASFRFRQRGDPGLPDLYRNFETGAARFLRSSMTGMAILYTFRQDR